MPHRLVAVALAAVLAATARADTDPSLDKIKASGTISLGHRESSIPFSFYDNEQKVIGYSQDLALLAVEAVKAALKLPKLEVKLTPITSQNRIPLVQNGTIDLECGSTTNNLERQKQVGFSTTIFVIGTRLLTRTDSGIKDFPDLAGKNVVTTAGTTSERLLRKLNDDKALKMSIVSAKDHDESFLMVESGRAVAFMMDDALLAGEMAKARDPKAWHIVGTPQSREAYGCMMSKDAPALKRIVDGAITTAMKSGQAEMLYRKWFQSPIPPKGLNLNLPLSDDMKALFKDPNDRALE